MQHSPEHEDEAREPGDDQAAVPGLRPLSPEDTAAETFARAERATG